MLLSETNPNFKNAKACKVIKSMAIYGKPYLAGDRYNWEYSESGINLIPNVQGVIKISSETFLSNFEIISNARNI